MEPFGTPRCDWYCSTYLISFKKLPSRETIPAKFFGKQSFSIATRLA
jgi:hypothetical protein